MLDAIQLGEREIADLEVNGYRLRIHTRRSLTPFPLGR